MMGKPLPKGGESDPLPCADLNQAREIAARRGEKLWFRVVGVYDHHFEVYPGGRIVAYSLEILNRRWVSQAPLAEGNRCKHVWETHTDSEPTGAGMHIEKFKQCFKCGEIR